MASILAFGSYLPERVLTNEDIAVRLDVTPDWIFEKSGIRMRRIADESQSVADLATAAGRNCLEASGQTATGLGLLMVASGSWERRFPGPAANVARQLGIAGVPCLDLPMASAGAIFGMALACQLVHQFGPILVIAAEKMSVAALREPLDKNTSMLFGDGAGACLVAAEGGMLEVVGSVLHSDGTYEADLTLEADGRLTMNGPSVIMQAARKIPGVISELLHKQSVKPEDIKCFLVHQANQNLIQRVAKTLGVPLDRFYSNIERYGNTSSASMLIASAEYFRETPPMRGNRFCFGGFGAGFHWGSVLARVPE